jgi:NitT/TauT family transport system substrate-binding protein
MRKYLISFICLFFINTAYAEKLVIATSNRGNLDTTFPEFAQKKGFLDNCNLDIKLFWSSAGAESIQALIAGSADISVAAPFPTVMGMYQKGAPVRIIGTSFTGMDTYYYVKNDSPIKSVFDLTGKKMGFPTVGSNADILLRNLRKNTGVNFESVATGSNMVANFANVMTDQIDGSTAAVPTLLDKVIAKEIRIIAMSSDFNKEHINVSNRLFLAHKDSLLTKRTAIECWMVGVKNGIDYFFDNEKAAEEYAEMVGFSVASVKMAKSLVTKDQLDMFKLEGYEQATKDGYEMKTISKPLTQENMNELYVKIR